MAKREGTNGVVVSSETTAGQQNLLDRLAEVTARLQEQNKVQQEQDLQNINRQIEQALQDLQNTKQRTAEAKDAQSTIQRQLGEAQHLLQDTQNSLQTLKDELQALQQRDGVIQEQLMALQKINEQADEALQATIAKFETRYSDWVEKLEKLTDDLNADKQTLQGLKRSDFLQDESIWKQVNAKVYELSKEVETLRTLLEGNFDHL